MHFRNLGREQLSLELENIRDRFSFNEGVSWDEIKELIVSVDAYPTSIRLFLIRSF